MNGLYRNSRFRGFAGGSNTAHLWFWKSPEVHWYRPWSEGPYNKISFRRSGEEATMAHRAGSTVWRTESGEEELRMLPSGLPPAYDDIFGPQPRLRRRSSALSLAPSPSRLPLSVRVWSRSQRRYALPFLGQLELWCVYSRSSGSRFCNMGPSCLFWMGAWRQRRTG